MRQIPSTHLQFRESYPEVAKAYEQLGKATQEWGPLDKKTRELVKLGIAIGTRHEGGVHTPTLGAPWTPEPAPRRFVIRSCSRSLPSDSRR